MARTFRNTNGFLFRRPKTTSAKRILSFKDQDLIEYGIKPQSINSFANAYDDKVIAATYEKPHSR